MNEYWAAKSDGIAKEIMGKVTGYKQYLESSGILTDLRKSYYTYYADPHIKDVDQSLKAISINHYANLIRHIHVMVTSTRPAWEPMAVNTDTKSQEATTLASGLLDYYMREKSIEKKLNNSTERALFLKEGWISLDWDSTAGEIVAPDAEEPENVDKAIKAGDVVIKTHTLLDVTRDVTRKDMNHEWTIVEEQVNKWDIAAQFPDYAEKIKQLQPEQKLNIYGLNIYNNSFKNKASDSDLIPMYILRHAKTAALPQGRIVKILSDDIKLIDGPLPTKRPYIFAMTGADKFEEAFGFSPLMDLLPIQNALDTAVSSALTNVAANGVQNFQAPKGAAPNVTEYEGGMNVWEYDPKAGKIEPLNLLNTAPEVYKFIDLMVNQEELISGVGQIGRGTAPANMSGTAMALLQQQAIQFSSGVQLNYTLMLENIGTSLIELLQDYAVEPRIAMIVGKSKRSMLKSFKGEDLGGVSRVFVNQANPLTKTGAGRVEIANNLLATPNMIKTPEQYIGVLTTGNLEPLYQKDNTARLLMASENEKLMEAQEVLALITDDHPVHIMEHSAVLDSPEARENPKVVKAALAHINEHLAMAKGMDPALAMVLKQASFYQPPMPPPAQGNAPSTEIPQVMDNQNPITQQAEQVQLPKPAQPPQI
jgi:hypothetical protein